MLAHIRQGDGTCWASQSDITRLVDVSRESACKWMGKLEACSWLEDDALANVGKRLDPALTARCPQLTWSDFAGFRDVLIHRYQETQLDLVWDATQEDLPALKDVVTALLTDLENAGARQFIAD